MSGAPWGSSVDAQEADEAVKQLAVLAGALAGQVSVCEMAVAGLAKHAIDHPEHAQRVNTERLHWAVDRINEARQFLGEFERGLPS